MAALMPKGRLHGLQKLGLYSNTCLRGIDSAPKVEDIAQMLRSNTSIEELDFCDNHRIGDEGVIPVDTMPLSFVVFCVYMCVLFQRRDEKDGRWTYSFAERR
jgi:hypothetical protein